MKKIFFIFIAVILLISSNLLADTWTEDFQSNPSTTYSATSVTISGRVWTKVEAGNFSYANTSAGSYGFTINDDKAGAHITTPALNTIGTVSFKYAFINGSDTNVFVLQKSTNGTDFTSLDTHTLGASANQSYVDYSFDVNDASTTVYIRVLSDYQNAHLFIDDFSVTDYSAGGNASPSIDNIVQTPSSNITSSTTVSVSADITDSDGTISGAELHWGTSSGSLTNTIDMSIDSGDTYVTDSDIPAQLDGTTVYYEVYAMDDDSDETTSSEQNYTVADPQPLNADFEANITSAYVDQNITFTDLSTGGTGGYTYAWDFNNDTITDSSDENPTHSYSSAGTYTVKLTVTDGAKGSDSETKVDYITITEAPDVASELFISEYVEKGNDKAIELFNGTGSSVDLSIYTVEVYVNGSTSGNSISLSGTLATNEVYVIAYNQAASSIQNIADNITNTLGFNGDDAVALLKDGSVIDVIGQIGVDPGSSWPVGTSGSTADQTLVRKSSIYSPNPTNLSSFGTTDDNCEWDIYPQGNYSYLGSHTFDGTGIIAGTVATPVISPEAGEYVNSVEVTISCLTDGAIIYYTTDGNDPTTGSTEYLAAFTITEDTTVKAFAVKDGDTDSAISQAIYTITAPDPLVADFSANTTSITVGEEVTFTDLTIGGVPGYLYSWDLNGDGEEDSALANPTFTYNSVGTYTVELLVYDQELTESTETKTAYINVFASSVEPSIGNLYISEVSDAYDEYIELYNNSDQLLTLENINLLMLRADGSLESTFDLDTYTGDFTILPNNYIIITRGTNRTDFENIAGSLPEGVNFLQGSTVMYFGTSTARRWQLVLITGAKAETIIDDTLEPVGGSGNTSYQSAPGVWVTESSSNNTPGLPTGDQTLPVTLASFMAIQTSDYYAQLTWETHSESGIAGYNVFRNESHDVSTAVQVNDRIISANNEATTSTYIFTDTETDINTTYYYWLESNEFDGSSLMHGPIQIRISQNNDTAEIVIPTKTLLRAVYPNPFNPSTTVNFYMDKADDVTINVFNVRGQLINTITRDNFAEGFHNVVWNGKDLDGRDCASGIYFFRMETKTESQMVKGILMK